MTTRFRLAVLLAAGWLGFGLAAGATPQPACLPIEGGGELSVTGLGRAVYAGLATDRARAAARLSGGVCLELVGSGAVVRSEVLEIRDLRGDVVVEAVDVTLEVVGWQLTTVHLRADATSVVLGTTVMRGDDAVARAGRVTIDLLSGTVEAHELRMLTASLWLDAASARLEGSRVIAHDTWLTTCDCPPAEASLRIEALRAEVVLEPLEMIVAGGTLVVGATRWPLPDPLVVDERRLASLMLPFTLRADPEERRGTLIAFEERTVAPGVRVAWDVGTGEGERGPDAEVRVHAREGGASVDVLVASDRLRLVWRLTWPWSGGTLSLGQRLEGGAWPEPVRDLDLRWTRGTGWVPVAGGRTDASATVFAAVSSQSLSDGEVVGSRFGVEGRWRIEANPASAVRPALTLAAGATRYPGDHAASTQAWLSLQPGVTARGPGWTADVRHLSRWVAGRSPFGTTLDRVSPLHRSDLVAAAVAESAGGVSMATQLSVRWNWGRDALRSGRAVGLERLDVGFSLRRSAWAGEIRLHADARLAGWLDPRTGRPFTLEGGVAWEGLDAEFGVTLRASPGAVETPTAVIVFGALPLRGEDWTLKPYLALDVASVGREGTPAVTGHGLDVTWAASFATVRLGYRHDQAYGTRLRASLTLEAREIDPERLRHGDPTVR